MKSFRPRLDSLPPEQRKLWPELREVPSEFVLYGGTALALRLGHRISVDFDFFSSEPFQVAELEKSLPFFENPAVSQRKDNALTFTIHRGKPIKLSFFGGISFGRVGEPEKTEDGVLAVASLLDLAGTKASVVQMRAEVKDYRDVLALLNAGISLETLLAAGQALYADQLNPIISLKALSYFGDGDLSQLSAKEKATLTEVVRLVDRIPRLERVSDRLSTE
ncbi:MAG TPA: nucleotidyl transferase AbiEii/AbiGii toxin family protein [Verrucomicrobiae bacterium]|nr:nucleotidyl transferase AbiEii/AbiGii toxin family protein [Verrucomicrobiae bacterium]